MRKELLVLFVFVCFCFYPSSGQDYYTHYPTPLTVTVYEQDQFTDFACENAHYYPEEPYRLVFQEEFQDKRLNLKKWNYNLNGIPPLDRFILHQCDSELQKYQESNIGFLDGDFLEIKFKREKANYRGISAIDACKFAAGQEFNLNFDFTSGAIHTIQGNNVRYGKIETRCKLPKGHGLWPAFWLFTKGYEIDIFEFFNTGDRPKEHCTNMIYYAPGGGSDGNSNCYDGVDFTEGFHTFAVEWDINFLKYYVDEKLVRTIPRFEVIDGQGRSKPVNCGDYVSATDGVSVRQNIAFPENWMNIILNLAVKHNEPPRASTPDQAGFLVDYVRVYQKIPEQSPRNLCYATLTGEGVLCKEAQTYYLESNSNINTVDWEVSANLEIINSTDSSVTVVPLESDGLAFIAANTSDLFPCKNRIEKQIQLAAWDEISVEAIPVACQGLRLAIKENIPDHLSLEWEINNNGKIIGSMQTNSVHVLVSPKKDLTPQTVAWTLYVKDTCKTTQLNGIAPLDCRQGNIPTITVLSRAASSRYIIAFKKFPKDQFPINFKVLDEQGNIVRTAATSTAKYRLDVAEYKSGYYYIQTDFEHSPQVFSPPFYK